jgi:hypothetical protein
MAITDATKAQGPRKVLLDHKREHVYSLEVILACFFEHFVGVFRGGKDLNDEVREHLDTTVKYVKGVLSAQRDGTRVAKKPTFAEV